VDPRRRAGIGSGHEEAERSPALPGRDVLHAEDLQGRPFSVRVRRARLPGAPSSRGMRGSGAEPGRARCGPIMARTMSSSRPVSMVSVVRSRPRSSTRQSTELSCNCRKLLRQQPRVPVRRSLSIKHPSSTATAVMSRPRRKAAPQLGRRVGVVWCDEAGRDRCPACRTPNCSHAHARRSHVARRSAYLREITGLPRAASQTRNSVNRAQRGVQRGLSETAWSAYLLHKSPSNQAP
jgi:hypothetical protein